MIRSKSRKILAIIPARGGSKGLPGKNIRILAGIPLIGWTIKQAKCSRYIDKVVVSTEDNVIAKISSEYGAEIIKRPDELAADDSPIIDAIFQVIESIKNDYYPDIIVLLQPTSPLRNTHDIDTAIELFINTNCDSVVSVCKVEHSPYWYFKIDNNNLKSLFECQYLNMRRQDLPDLFRPNGAIYITATNNLYKNNGFFSDEIIPYIMPEKRSIDIDNDIDFKLAELLMTRE